MYKKILVLFLFFLGQNAFGEITATDPNDNNFELSLSRGQTTTLSIQIDTDTDGDEIISERIYGAGVSFRDSCIQTLSAPELSCTAVLEVDANAKGTKRAEFRTASGQRLRVTISIDRVTSDPVVDGNYADFLEVSPSDNVNFGQVTDRVYQLFYIQNTGTAPTGVIAPITTETDGYFLGSNTCSGSVLGPRGKCRLIVFFEAGGLFGGSYTDTLNIKPISGSATPLTISLAAEIPTQPQSTLEIDAGFTKVDPSTCLSLGGINPSECFYQADLPTSGETNISGVSCTGVDPDPKQCSVVIQKKLANEPVEFIITVNYEDSVEALDPADFSLSIDPSPLDLGTILVGQTKRQVYTITNNHGTNDLPLPITVSLIDPTVLGSHCSQPIPGGGIPDSNSCESSGGIASSGNCLIEDGVFFDGNTMSQSLCTGLYGESGATWQAGTAGSGALDELRIVSNTCASRSAALPAGQTCSVEVEVAPEIISSNREFIVRANAAGNTEESLNTYSGGDPTVTHELTILITGQGSVSGQGVSCSEGDQPCVISIVEGEILNLEGQGVLNISEFSSWSNDCSSVGDSSSTCSITMDQPRTVGVEFSPIFSVIASTTGDGLVSSSIRSLLCGDGNADCTEYFSQGETVSFTATATNGKFFGGWSGDCAGQGPVCSISIDSNKTIGVDFISALPVTVALSGSGSVSDSSSQVDCGSSCSGFFSPGDLVVLEATPDSGQYFTGWTGGPCDGSSALVCSFSISDPQTITANFAVDETKQSLALFGTYQKNVNYSDKQVFIGDDLYTLAPSLTPTKGMQIFKTDTQGGSSSELTNMGLPTYNKSQGIYTEQMGGLTAVGSSLYYFYHTDSSGAALWKLNPTQGVNTGQTDTVCTGSENPCIVKAATPTIDTGVINKKMESIGNNLFYLAKKDAADSFSSLWKFNTSLGVNSGNTDCSQGGNPCLISSNSTVKDFTKIDSKIYFAQNDGAGYDLFETDGITTSKVGETGISGSAATSSLTEITSHGGAIYCLIDSQDSSHLSLWKLDGSFTQVKNISTEEGAGGADVIKGKDLISAHGKLFFVVDLEKDGGLHTQDIWTSDGTGPNTQSTMDLNPGQSVENVEIASSNNQLVISADINDGNGQELWVYKNDSPVVSAGGADCGSGRNPCRVEAAPGFPSAKVSTNEVSSEGRYIYFLAIATVPESKTTVPYSGGYLYLEKKLMKVDTSDYSLSYVELFTDISSSDFSYNTYYFSGVDNYCKIQRRQDARAQFDPFENFFTIDYHQLIRLMQALGLSYTHNLATDCNTLAVWADNADGPSVELVFRDLFVSHGRFRLSLQVFNYIYQYSASVSNVSVFTGNGPQKINAQNFIKKDGKFYVVYNDRFTDGRLRNGECEISDDAICPASIYRKSRLISFASPEPHERVSVPVSSYPALALINAGGRGVESHGTRNIPNTGDRGLEGAYYYNQPVKVNYFLIEDYFTGTEAGDLTISAFFDDDTYLFDNSFRYLWTGGSPNQLISVTTEVESVGGEVVTEGPYTSRLSR